MSAYQEISKKLLSDKKGFDSYAYTKWEDAVMQLSIRRTDKRLIEYINKSLPHGFPSAIKDTNKPNLAIFRHIATPNFEIARFLAIADFQRQFNSVILEYTEDKFNDRNDMKYFLGKLRFHKRIDKNKNPIVENITIINFNDSNNKPISNIHTHWGQNLVDFHHELFDKQFKNFSKNYFDISEWLHLHGAKAKDYYKSFLTLFLKDGILFENFLTDGSERSFTESVVLPIMIEIENDCGYKPLIIQLAPTKIEADDYWFSYPHKDKEILNEKVGG